LQQLDGVRRRCLGVEQDGPHVAGHVIDEQQDEGPASRCSGCHGAAKVAVHELELLLGTEARLARKGEPPLLGEDAGVTELLHVLDSRHALRHLLVAELLQGLRVKVPKALVPPLGVIVAVGCKAHELRHLYMEDVEAVGASVHLGEKAMMAIPNPQDPVLDLHTQAILI
jgi:hypothetical protein